MYAGIMDAVRDAYYLIGMKYPDRRSHDITEFSEYGNKWEIYIDDYVLNKAYNIVQQGTASKKFVSDIKNGLFMIVDSKQIEQQ